MKLRNSLSVLIFLCFSKAVYAEELTEITILASRDRPVTLRSPVQQVSAAELAESKVLTVNEALRKLPGVLARDEEGLGLRPNIGIRGLNPTRSAKVLLLEDGLPLAFAPYGDNASYFHPALERFERIELLKNAGQIAFGPQTIGGIINYISAPTPDRARGRIAARGGNHGLRALDLELGDRFAEQAGGWRLDATHKHSRGSRRNIELDAGDVGLKIEQALTASQSLTLRLNGYRERSQVPYSGLTLAEYREDPRGNPFVNDFFAIDRQAMAMIHGLRASETVTLRTALYHTRLQRDWWRQSSTSRQRPNDATDPACGDMRNLLSSCGNEGRVRGYRTLGIEPRLQIDGVNWRALAGVRHHREWQERLQLNGDTPRARSVGSGINGGVREDNRRRVVANSGFVETTLSYRSTAVTAGLRYEDIRYARADRLRGTAGTTALNTWVPGFAVTQQLPKEIILFAGVHKGFAPPRVEDAIANDGTAVELDGEYSWNTELGMRWRIDAEAQLEVTFFDMDFANQVIPASLAGGGNATLTNGGRTRHRGVELLGEWRAHDFIEPLAGLRPRVRVAANWLREAKFVGDRLAAANDGSLLSISGNRLPYAARQLVTLTVGGEWANGFSAQVEGHYVGSMYADDLNTVAVSSDGQRGRLAGHAIWNLAVNYRASEQLEWFAGAKNVADRLYIADRSRGIVPGPSRQLQAGFEYRF
ncbi:MAG: TonB-dependent receptor family protein [Gammaproteobacteria bacterium]